MKGDPPGWVWELPKRKTKPRGERLRRAAAVALCALAVVVVLALVLGGPGLAGFFP